MNYYNEWDSFAAEWLKQLIKDGLIPDGEVDSRSIADVEPSDLKGFTQCHFFAGIGGWSRALQLAGWSSDRPVWTGSPPCQSFSTAGKGKGKDDERHLWPVFFNLIRECQPPTVFGEQVAAAIRFGWLDDLQIDFEKEGYAAGAFVLSAGSIGAPHKRDRLFFTAERVGDSNGSASERKLGAVSGAQEKIGGEGELYGDLFVGHTNASQINRPSSVADSNNKRHERSSSDGRQEKRGSEHAGSCSLADTTSGRHKQSEQFSNGCPSQSDKRQSDSSGNCESQRQLVADSVKFGQSRPGQVRRSCDSEANNAEEINRTINDGSISMANSNGERCGGKEWGGEAEEKGQSERYSSERSSHSSVGNTDSDRPKSRNEAAETAGHGNPINSASIRSDSVGNTEHDGSYEAEIGRSTGSGEDEGRLLESQRSDTADSAGIRAETVGNPEHNGSHGAEIGRGAIEASYSGEKGQDVSCESEGAGRSEIAGDICFWQDSTVIYCRDGKYRPIPTEPALFPLADGIPNRVGLLRGAGNAIVPQAAAEIIKAYLYD